MAARTVEVNQRLLRQAIEAAEAHGPLASQRAVWAAAADIYNRGRQDAPEISWALARLRATKLGIELKTQKVESQPLNRGDATKQTQGRADPEGFKRHFARFPYPTEQRAQQCLDGSRKACIELNCIECVGGEVVVDKENLIKACSIVNCPFWAFRPFQSNKEEA